MSIQDPYHRAHILVVEDEEHIGFGLKFNLEAEGYQVTLVNNGLDALQAVQQDENPVELLILDLMLPGMSGYEVCEKIRERGHRMPVLMLSARTLSEDRTRGFDTGANQYMVKPFELKELLSRVKNLLSQAALSPFVSPASKLKSTQYEFGEVSINFQTYEVKVKGKPVRLTQLQMKTLKYFAEREGEVVTRVQLLQEVWGLPGHINTRAPDQIMRQLRKMFEIDPANPVHFLTIRDAGYRFVKNPAEAG
jgi:two-component system alkaline phosphatase synthesis response regulator PhoP